MTPAEIRSIATERLTRDWSETTRRLETDEYARTLYRATEDADRKVAERVAEVAKARGVPRAQVALGWLLAKPIVTAPIIGASKPHHLTDAVAALSLKLSAEEIAALEQPYAPHTVAGFS